MRTLIAILILFAPLAHAADPIALWPDGAPMANGSGKGHTPTITPYLLSDSAAPYTTIIIAPGGGYGGLAVGHEGKQIGEWLNANGIQAFVLRYRHAPNYRHPVPKMDIQRAIQTVRAQAAPWNVNPDRIGVLGFSAGGHLAATAATQFTLGEGKSSDAITRASSRPDFAILLYPVITLLPPHAHMGSRSNLLGDADTDALATQMSPHLNVSSDTPPIFLAHTSADTAVPAQNSILMYTACLEAKVPAALHIFQEGPHGLGMARKDLPFGSWPSLCLEWLRALD